MRRTGILSPGGEDDDSSFKRRLASNLRAIATGADHASQYSHPRCNTVSNFHLSAPIYAKAPRSQGESAGGAYSTVFRTASVSLTSPIHRTLSISQLHRSATLPVLPSRLPSSVSGPNIKLLPGEH